jgi:hypothetical protein
MTTERTVTLYAEDGLTVTANRGPADELVIAGQDLKNAHVFDPSFTEYEYTWTIDPEHIPRLLEALRASPQADVLDVLAAKGRTIVLTGEERWLKRHRITADFWNHAH